MSRQFISQQLSLSVIIIFGDSLGKVGSAVISHNYIVTKMAPHHMVKDLCCIKLIISPIVQWLSVRFDFQLTLLQKTLQRKIRRNIYIGPPHVL